MSFARREHGERSGNQQGRQLARLDQPRRFGQDRAMPLPPNAAQQWSQGEDPE